MDARTEIISWLLEGDPAIRWQVMRDLLREPSEVWELERGKVATEGWGRRLLDEQRPDGEWGGGIYSPKWKSTTYTLLALRHFGLFPQHPQAQRGCERFFFRGLERDGGINLFKTIQFSETCVNGMILTLLSYFRYPDERIHSVADFLFRAQMADGGWNCRWNSEKGTGAMHASFNTTLLVLQGLDEYRRAFPEIAQRIEPIVARGLEFLLLHHLYKSHRTGRVVDMAMTQMHFPPRWRYDFLAALDYLQSIRADRDERIRDGIDLLQKRCASDGRWPLSRNWPGRTFFEIEQAGQPSRWNTLRAMRVLKWWEGT